MIQEIGISTRRFETKYFVPESDLDGIRQEIAEHMVLDRYSVEGGGNYAISSVYYDTRELKSYYERLAGVRRRRTLRIRGYNSADGGAEVFLEIKRKNGGAVTKQRARVQRMNIADLIQSRDAVTILGPGHEDLTTAETFLRHVERHDLRPVVLVRYTREAYAAAEGAPLRLTIDHDVRSAPSHESSDPYRDTETSEVFPGRALIEVKSVENTPIWLVSVLERYGLEREAISKYTFGAQAAGVVPENGTGARTSRRRRSQRRQPGE